MTAELPKYIEASRKHDTPEFWWTFFPQYWCLFNWRLKLNEEPPDTPEEEPADTEAAFIALDLELTEDEKAGKKAIQAATKTKIKGWYNRQRPAHIGIQGNPYFGFLAQMRKRSDEPPPKRVSDYQYYLQHPDFKEKVAAQFAIASDSEPKSKHLAIRCRVARELLAEESEEVRQQLKEEAKEVHEQEMAEYEEEDQGLLSVDPEMTRVRARFLETVGPLLEGLQVYTEYTINIVAAWVEEENFDTVSVNTDMVGGKDWARWDPAGYAQMLPSFLKFVHARHLEATGSIAPAGPSIGPSTTIPVPEPADVNAPTPAISPTDSTTNDVGPGPTNAQRTSGDVDMPPPAPLNDGPPRCPHSSMTTTT
ncbi:hypothetical protein C8R44DRAFT_886068 [Mycena epipterygia]|nr:hypothetical protein C8R44DRAFT_886068 [Mycena epipterygia]